MSCWQFYLRFEVLIIEVILILMENLGSPPKWCVSKSWHRTGGPKLVAQKFPDGLIQKLGKKLQISFLLGKGCDIVRRSFTTRNLIEFWISTLTNQRIHRDKKNTRIITKRWGDTSPLCFSTHRLPPKIIPVRLSGRYSGNLGKAGRTNSQQSGDCSPAQPAAKKSPPRAQVVLMMGLRFRLPKKPRDFHRFVPSPGLL